MIKNTGFPDRIIKNVKATQQRDALKIITGVYNKIVVEFDTKTNELISNYLDGKINFTEYSELLREYYKSL